MALLPITLPLSMHLGRWLRTVLRTLLLYFRRILITRLAIM